MKKLLALLLILAMVLSMGLVAQAEEPAKKLPFYTINWSGNFLSDFDYVYDMPFFYSPSNVKKDVLDVSWNGARTIPTLAQALKKEFDARPDGTRYINFAALANAMGPNDELYLYHEKIMGLTKAWLEEFLAEYKNIGGKLDGIILDIEFVGARGWELSKRVSEDRLYYQKVVQHPMYATTFRPLLEEYGFNFWKDITPETPEIYSADSRANDSKSVQIWDVVIRNRLAIYLNEAVTEPLLKYYPDAEVNDYQSCAMYNWQKRPGDDGATITGGNRITVGTSSNFNSYAFRPNTTFFTTSGIPNYKTLPGYNDAVFEPSPFHQVMWDMKLYKDIYMAAPTNKISAWMCSFNYGTNSDGNNYCKTPYYSELFYHIGMLDPQPFLGYITPQIADDRNTDFDYYFEVIDDIMEELTRVAGYADRKSIYIPTTWNDGFILSGMYAGGRNIWRLTPDLSGGMTLDQFKVADATDPTFTYEGQTVTFPGGKIIEDGKVREVGSCGYWIETPKDVMPQVTSSVNRYAEFPAFAETFEVYEDGTDYVPNVQPTGTWEVKKGKDGTAIIQTVNGNKVLAIKGTNSLKNVKMPKNITAGDTYAEDQTWEVTVTVPAGMTADAEIVILNVFSSISKSEEGGFKIAGGKVYYDNAGKYVELPGVDVSAGGTYTFKRTVNFNKADAFNSDYAVLDSTGKQLAKVNNIPMVTVKVPVQRIGLSVANVTGDAVLFDNYKLYASGVATDFELYDAESGVKQTDITKARETDTAYRLSWMNATSTEKVYSVIAAYYNGDTLVSEKVIKEIKMAPGTDAVDYDIVKNEEGKTLKVYLRNDSQPEPEDVDDVPSTAPQGGDPIDGPAPKDDNMLLIIIIAAVAVLVVAGIVVLVVVKKKKTVAKKPQETEAVEEPKETEE